MKFLIQVTVSQDELERFEAGELDAKTVATDLKLYLMDFGRQDLPEDVYGGFTVVRAAVEEK